MTDPNTQPNETTHQSEDPNETQQPNEDTQQLTNDTEPEVEEVFDPQSIVRDIVEDDRTGRNLRLAEEYIQQKTNLIGSVVNTSAGLSWTVCHDITASEVHKEHDTLVGIKNFDFNNKRMKTSGRGLVQINFLDLLVHLWPGDWKVQLTELNHRIHGD